MQTGLRDHLITAHAALVRGAGSVAVTGSDDMLPDDALEFLAELQDLLQFIECHLAPVLDGRGRIDEIATFGQLRE